MDLLSNLWSRRYSGLVVSILSRSAEGNLALHTVLYVSDLYVRSQERRPASGSCTPHAWPLSVSRRTVEMPAPWGSPWGGGLGERTSGTLSVLPGSAVRCSLEKHNVRLPLLLHPVAAVIISPWLRTSTRWEVLRRDLPHRRMHVPQLGFWRGRGVMLHVACSVFQMKNTRRN